MKFSGKIVSAARLNSTAPKKSDRKLSLYKKFVSAVRLNSEFLCRISFLLEQKTQICYDLKVKLCKRRTLPFCVLMVRFGEPENVKYDLNYDLNI